MKRLLFTLSAFLFLMGGTLSAATITVDDSGTADYTLIQDAVDAAVSGDTVYVYPGHYNGRVVLKDGVILKGSGADITTIDGQGNYNQVIYYYGSVTGAAEVSGFTITGAKDYNWVYTCGVLSGQGKLTLTNNIITGNRSGVVIYRGEPVILNNTITGNSYGIIHATPGSTSYTPSSCYPSLPAPELSIWKIEELNSGATLRFRFRVSNWYNFPDEFFDPAPSLPPCGSNTNAARAWVDIYDENNTKLYGFCALPSNANLYESLWVAVPAGNVPEQFYITIEDRQCGYTYNSNLVNSDSQPSKYIIMNNIIAGNSVHGIQLKVDNRSGQIAYNDLWDNGVNYYDLNTSSTFTPWPGTGEISADPLFVDAVNENYHLDPASPAVDAGNPLPIYNDPDGTRNDMGAYGGYNAINGPASYSGNGFFFTSIGRVPTTEIIQSSTLAAEVGLADVTPAVAAEYGIPAFKKSPFGSKLWIHGLFGETGADANVKYYQILAGKWNGNTPPAAHEYVTLSDPLSKIKFDAPGGPQRISLGPRTISGYDNLYELTDSGIWNHIDLRMIWDTRSWPDGKYTLKYKAFEQSAFIIGTSAQPITLADNPTGLDELTVIINNKPVEAEIIELQYPAGVPVPECGIIDLTYGTDNIRFLVKARHPDGYLESYSLVARYGNNHTAGYVARDTYANHSSGLTWYGTLSQAYDSSVNMSLPVSDPLHLQEWQTCGYSFQLYVRSRSTNGVTYIIDKRFDDHYYLDVEYCSACGK